MKIELPINQVREIIESIEWIADEFEGYPDLDRYVHRDIVSAYYSLRIQLCDKVSLPTALTKNYEEFK